MPFCTQTRKTRFAIQFRTGLLNVNLSQALQTAFQLHGLARAQATLWCAVRHSHHVIDGDDNNNPHDFLSPLPQEQMQVENSGG